MVVMGVDNVVTGVTTEEACKRVLITSKGLVRQAATVPAAPPDIRLTTTTTKARVHASAKGCERKKDEGLSKQTN